MLGDLNGLRGEIGRLFTGNPVQVTKPRMGIFPKVFYIEADLDALKAERRE